MSPEDTAQQWATLRFVVIGRLLCEPPKRGELQKALEKLASRPWRLPDGTWRTFGFSTIERWYYEASKSPQPAEALRRRIRSDLGAERVMSKALLDELAVQYRVYPSWSYKLHADNLVALVEEKPELGKAPSYTTVRRRMKSRGWRKQKKARTAGQKRAARRLDELEVRSYEKQHAHALWHFDFHECSRKVLVPNGRLLTPVCLCILDDFSRVICHIQWYLTESAETLAHGLCQAFMKRGVPRSALSDNGAAMLAAETSGAMDDLSIVHETTLAYSPYQNGKQETFWERLEGRLVAMLSAVTGLRLELLNRATQAWGEQEYNRNRHDELGCSPIERLLGGPSVERPSPQLDQLRFHFTRTVKRKQRRSDGTISVEGVRYEVPSRMRHQDQLVVRYARWDLGQVFVVDPRHTRQRLATLHPQDKAANADGRRKHVQPTLPDAPEQPREAVPPLLRKILADYAATGLPPAYLPHATETEEQDDGL
jgi:transposase InsO family protein